MALIKCSECKKDISDKAECCPNCGCPISAMKQSPVFATNEKKNKRKGSIHLKALIAIVAISTVMILIAVLLLTHVICFHSYSEASVLEPQTCYRCGKTRGEPKALIEITFPKKGLATLLPTPQSNMGEICWDNSSSVYIYIGNMSLSDYDDYVTECSKKGFDIDYQKGTDYYYADDINGNRLNLNYYIDSNIMAIQIIKQSKDEFSESDESKEPTIVTNSRNNITPYLSYIGTIIPSGESLKLEKKLYENMDNVEFMGMKGGISYKSIDDYISSCTWTSFDFYSENEYREIAESLSIYFNAEPDADPMSYGSGNTYRYYWSDSDNGFIVSYAHGFFAYDPNGNIEIKWELYGEINGGVQKELSDIIEILSGTKENAEYYYHIADKDDNDLIIEGSFAGLTGNYRVCCYDDGSIWRIIFERDQETIDEQKILKNICQYLGDYAEYNPEYNSYQWKNDDIEVEFYINERIYFDLINGCSNVGHQNSEWSEWDNDYDKAVKVREICCTKCGVIIETETEDITSFIDGDHFIFHPHALKDRFDDSSNGINGYSFYSKQTYDENKLFFDEDNTVFYEIQDKENNYAKIGMYSFSKGNDISVPISEAYTEGCSKGINVLIEDASDVSAVVVAMVMAIDPKLSYSESFDVAQNIVDNVGDMEGFTYNSINYLLYKANDYPRYHYVLITIDS